MRVLIQRVTDACVEVNGAIVGRSAGGLLVFVCAMTNDTEKDVQFLVRKVAQLRIFADDAGKMNLSVIDKQATALVVSQFTLAADTRRGNRPGFSSAAPPDDGRKLYELFCDLLQDQGIGVESGEFGVDMQVHLTNDGPVTIWLDSDGLV